MGMLRLMKADSSMGRQNITKTYPWFLDLLFVALLVKK